jgi:TolB-like protein
MGYEMLTGAPPFVRRTPQEVLAAHVTEPAPAVSARRQSVPPALDALIAKCLLKQPGDRYQSADEVVSELERISTPTAGMSPAAGVSPTAGPPPSRSAAVTTGGMRFRRAGLAVGVTLVLIAAGWFASARWRSGSATDANLVAVLPFEFSGAPALAYLREGIVNVLESNLTGEGGPRAVASQTAIAQWKRRGGAERGLTEEEARAIARALGAGQLLRGSIVAAGTDLVISASLVQSGGGGRAVQAQVKGPADSIASLAMQMAGQLLSLRVGEAAERLHSLQLVPPPALRQYLIGQQALRESRFADAYLAFAAALAQDSTFALAGLGLSTAQSWSLTSLGAGDGVAIAFRHRDRLGPRDLVLLEMTSPARFAGHSLSLREVTDLRERLVQQIPDRPEGWYLIGDNYFHRGAAMGLAGEEAMRRAMFAFGKVLALDPGITYVQGHVAQKYWVEGDYARAVQLAESLHIAAPELTISARVRAGDTADVARYRADLASLNRDQLLMFTLFNAGWPIADSASALALAHSTDAGQRESLLRVDRRRLMAEGRPSAARQASARLAQVSGPAADDAVPDVLYDAVFASGDSIAGAEAASAVTRSLRPMGDALKSPAFTERVPAFLAGLWASYRNDTAGLSSATRRLDAMAGRTDSVHAAAAARLAADVLRLLGSHGPSDLALVGRVDSTLRDGPPRLSPDMRTAMNLVVARSWERLGDARRAALAAERGVTYESTGGLQMTAALRDAGRLKLAAGDTAGAIRSWRNFLASRGRAEPSQRTRDDEIRRKLLDIERGRR